jgi:hypothetical protein
MTQPRWPGGDRRPPQRGRPGAYPRPDPGACDRDRPLYRDERGMRGDERDMHGDDRLYRPERGVYGDDGGVRGELYRHPSAPSHGPRWGTLPGGTSVCIVIASAALGALITAVTGSQPGLVLGLLLVGGTVTAALAVRPRAAYQVIPVPALAYVVAATLAGLVSDRATGTSLTALAVNAAQWIASGFIAMTAATGLAIVITLVRWYTSRRSQRDPRRGPGDPAHDQRRPHHWPDAAAEGARHLRAPSTRSAQRRLERDPNYPWRPRTRVAQNEDAPGP